METNQLRYIGYNVGENLVLLGLALTGLRFLGFISLSWGWIMACFLVPYLVGGASIIAAADEGGSQ